MKNKINFGSVFIFLFLILFPFGQLIRFKLKIAGLELPILGIDIVAGLALLYNIFIQKEISPLFKHIRNFLIVATFTYILSFAFYKKDAFYGLFYLLRIIAYSYFVNYIWIFTRNSIKRKELLVDSLLVVSIASAIFGWIQYFSIPDLKPFFYFGWDMHLYRLAGTFLDPTFLGLVIVFGLIILIEKLIKKRKTENLWIFVFLILSLAFTYARAAYLAFLAGILIIGIYRKKIKKVFLLAIILIVIALILPTTKNKSIELTRTFSISARVVNYKETLSVFKKNPILGVGFNNMCAARNRYIGREGSDSHACSGSDSSLLLILATTGTVGLFVFLDMSIKFLKNMLITNSSTIPVAFMAALFVHSLFSNSIFFPWIMGSMAIIMGSFVKEKN